METDFDLPVENTRLLEIPTNSLKLIKNTKGYNWEIKIASLDLEQLKQINAELEKEYGTRII